MRDRKEDRIKRKKQRERKETVRGKERDCKREKVKRQ
jgi:hypothetical protein